MAKLELSPWRVDAEMTLRERTEFEEGLLTGLK